MLDFSPEIKLDAATHNLYLRLRLGLLTLFVVAGLFLAYKILFPILPFYFSFSAQNALKNTLVFVGSQTGQALKKGALENNAALQFHANFNGNFSTANLQITLDKKSSPVESGQVKLRKTFFAFNYPNGRELCFADGTLLTIDGKYYLANNQQLHKLSASWLLKSKLEANAFLKATPADLAGCQMSFDIADTTLLVEGLTYKYNEQYFQLLTGELHPFLSEAAFLSRFNPTQALELSTEDLATAKISESKLGFADGSLLKLDTGGFIISGQNLYPIDNEATVLAMGFNFDDFIPATSAEIASYAKQKLFTQNNPHPDGTIFLEQAQAKYFLIQNGQKHPLSPAAALSFNKRTPVLINATAAEQTATCQLQKKLWRQTLACSLPLETLSAPTGNTYAFSANFPSATKLEKISVVFKRTLSFKNLLISLAEIKNRIIGNYSTTTQP